MAFANDINRLAELVGVEESYWDAFGTCRETDEETKAAILAAFGYDVGDSRALKHHARELKDRDWRRWMAPIQVLRRGPKPFTARLSMPDRYGGKALRWALHREDGAACFGEFRLDHLRVRKMRDVDGGRIVRVRLPLPASLPDGYHTLRIEAGDEAAESLIAVAPPRGYVPPWMAEGERRWGVNSHLYSLRSGHDWGMGDFSGLGALADATAGWGGDMVGINPIHALFHTRPDHASPYSPSSRLFLNPLYIDVTAAPEFDGTVPDLSAVRAASHVDYPAVARLKQEAFAGLFARLEGARADAFAAFRAAGGQALQRFAVFETLQEAFDGAAPAAWPAACRKPDTPEVEAFARDNEPRVAFHAYLQWLAEEQLHAAAARCTKAGLGVGIYRDLAVGVDPGGADVWADPETMVVAARFGAPPDGFNPFGQDWGMPPLNPMVLKERRYAPFIAMLRANMRHAGALRIDHAMGLQHLYWVPDGAKAADGAYVSYPFGDLLGILALESQRHRCLVIGEDLGTVPEDFRTRMAQEAALSYRIVLFERWDNGLFKRPDVYPAVALATATTHDLPTLPGWWRGRDLEIRAAAGMFASAEVRLADAESRTRDTALLVAALIDQKLLPEGFPPSGSLDAARLGELTVAVQAFLARSPAVLALLNLDDLTMEAEQLNLPGTVTEYPNWRRRLNTPLEALAGDPFIAAVARAVTRERAAPLGGPPRATVPAESTALAADIDLKPTDACAGGMAPL